MYITKKTALKAVFFVTPDFVVFLQTKQIIIL